MTINWNRRTYAKSDFISAWNESRSIAECARKLGLTVYGSTYKTIKGTALELGLNDKHMTGQGWNVGRKFDPTAVKVRPVKDILVKGSSANTSNLKKRLIKEGLLTSRCYSDHCQSPSMIVDPDSGLPVEIKYQLDHINGVNNDNRIENLRLLCPNCHSATKTFCRGNGKKKKVVRNIDPLTKCECGGRKHKASVKCKKCDIKARRSKSKTKIDWPPLDELLKLVAETNYVQTGLKLGVSDTAVRKHIKKQLDSLTAN